MTILSTKSGGSCGMCLLIQYDSAKLSTICSGWREKESVEIRKWHLLEMKLIEWSKYLWCSAKESSVLGKRVVGARQKNRRFSAKESSVLFKRSDDATRKQSMYSQKSINCYAVEGSNMGPKHSKIIVFPFGFSWSFLSVAFLSLWIHLEQHCRVRRFRKEVCYSDES